MILRPHQENIETAISAAYARRVRRVAVCAPTGSGKSYMLGDMLSRTGMQTLVLCHREELLDMICGDLSKHGIRHARIETGRVPLGQIHVGMYQSVARRLSALPQYRWVISDEVHLAMCATWMRVLQHYGDAFHLGLSATPTRLDGRGLGDFFEELIQGPSIRALTSLGLLAPCRVFAPPGPEMKVRKVAGEFSMDAAAEIMDRASITGDCIAEYRRRAPGRQAIVFCCSVRHAEHVAAQFSAAGISATNIDGTLAKDERRRRVDAFKAGRVTVLTNVELATTGLDVPQIGCGIFLRPTESLALYLQMVGRILRIAPGKADAVLLDHCGNVSRHGLPHTDREWTLNGRKQREAVPPIRQCPKCYAVHEPAPRCPECQHTYVTAPSKRRIIAARAGELVEVTDAAPPPVKKAELSKRLRACRTYADVDALRKEFGYKPFWTRHMMKIYRIDQKREAA